MTELELKKVHQTLSLLNSMVNGGEQHSTQSVEMCKEAFAIVKNYNLHFVTNCAFPEWLDSETIAKAKDSWDSHKSTDDNLRVKAIKIIQLRGKAEGYDITIKKAMELFQKHCL